jgi:hypothetical protein
MSANGQGSVRRMSGRGGDVAARSTPLRRLDARGDAATEGVSEPHRTITEPAHAEA